MTSFVLRRMIQALPILLGVTIVAFGMVHLMPGSVADLLIPAAAPPEMQAEINRLYGLDQPLWEQYARWFVQLLQGNFGVSLVSGRPIAADLLDAIANTLQITLVAAVLGFALGILFGAIAAYGQGKLSDRTFSFLAILGVSLPHYWLAVLLVWLFAVNLNWLPAQGMGESGFPTTWDQWRHMILPVITLSLIPMGMVGRLVRASVLEVLSQDFVTALDAKGLKAKRVFRHVAQNAAPPVLALMGLQFGYLLGGSILVETVFNWPGTGKLLNLAIYSRDIPVIQATVLVLSVIFVLVNLLVDVLQAVVDPRMRR